MHTRGVAIPVAISLLSALVVGCGSSAASAASPPSTINASEKEFSVSLDSTNAASGNVTFDVTNTGTVAHEFVVFRTDLQPDKLTVADGKLDEAETGLNHINEVEDITPGTDKKLTVNLAPGRYLLICNLPGHFAGGMKAIITVS